ncbi:MAG: signal peptidase I [Parcubacteria group bacterium]|nr:signal peptidase I [Parcubacteria group bacterium]
MTEPAMEKNEAVEEQKKESFFSLIAEVVRFSIIALLFIVPIRVFIAQPYIVSGASMHPTFETGEYLIVDQFSYRFKEPARGEVIIFRFPVDPSKYFIKRVIGLPGETVMSNGTTLSVLAVDGKTIALEEPYIADKMSDVFEKKLGSDEYFVMGDNRRASLDSRFFGAVERKYFVGRALVRLLPPTKIGVFPGIYDYANAK